MSAIEALEKAAGDDGYVIAKHTEGYTIRLRGAVGKGNTLDAAIKSAIDADQKDAEMLDDLEHDIDPDM